MYKRLNQALFWTHWAIIFWMFVGSIVVAIWLPHYLGHQLLFLATIVGIQVMLKGKCPLTIWEKSLLLLYAPEKVYEGSFLRYHWFQWTGRTIPPHSIFAATLVLLFGLLVLWVKRP